jgi:dTDP-4-dehydrorhamnose reductase
MRVLILGDGLLGSELVKQTGWDYLSRRKDGFDLISSPLNFSNYSTVVNCIANTDTYSTDKQGHWDTNYKAVVRLADYCRECGIKLVHISSDYVYTNSQKNASEECVPIHGNNWYSYTKLLGDSYVQLNPQNLILRGTHKPKPFPYPAAWINQVGNFDYVDRIANLYINLINHNATGVYNVGTEIKTMHSLATQTKENVIPREVDTNQVPGCITMNVEKLQKLLK